MSSIASVIFTLTYKVFLQGIFTTDRNKNKNEFDTKGKVISDVVE